MTRLRLHHVLTAAVALGAVAACDDPVEPGQEQELITRVTVVLTPTGGGAAQTAVINDPDGLGPQPPSAPSITFQLDAGETYDGAITFEDASDPGNVIDITEEVEEEALEHRVFYTVSGADVDIPDSSLDLDGNGAPLGLVFQAEVDGAATGSGTIRVILSHYDEEPKGDGSVPSDETDIDVTYDFSIN